MTFLSQSSFLVQCSPSRFFSFQCSLSPFFSLFIACDYMTPLLHFTSIQCSSLSLPSLEPIHFHLPFQSVSASLTFGSDYDSLISFQGFLLSIKSVYIPFIYTAVRYCIHFTLCFSQWAKENVIQVIPQILLIILEKHIPCLFTILTRISHICIGSSRSMTDRLMKYILITCSSFSLTCSFIYISVQHSFLSFVHNPAS